MRLMSGVEVSNISIMQKMGHVLVLLYPTQGHINPMLQFSKRLVSKSQLKVTLITALISEKCFSVVSSSGGAGKRIQVEILDDDDVDYDKKKADHEGPDELVRRFKSIMEKKLPELIKKELRSDEPPKVLVYDSSMPWAYDFAKDFGLVSAAFFTQSSSVTALYYLFKNGNLNISDSVSPLPEYLPIFGINELPTFIVDKGKSYPLLTTLMTDQSDNFHKADWILFNTFDQLEPEVLKYWTSVSKSSVKTIGPTIPSAYLGLDKKINEDDMTYGFNKFEPKIIDSCIEWLNEIEEAGSVVYVSFGSMSSLSKEQMEEVAYGLINSKCHFLWVVRSGSEEANIPNWFKEKMMHHQKGHIVSWCDQLAVLGHKAVGCFVTHCGWNSTMEAISLGVPMVGMPQWSDQMTNAKYIMDVWGVGVRAKVDDKGIFSRQEIETCVKKVIKELETCSGTVVDNHMTMTENALKWKKLAVESVLEGGTSFNNIQDFISSLTIDDDDDDH